MSDKQITVTTLTNARRRKRKFDAILTVEDPHQRHPLRFHRSPHPEQLVLKLEDLDHPDTDFALPREEHVQAAIEFGRRHTSGSLLVHCRAGIARSTAVALAIIADRDGKGREEESVRQLLDIRPEAAPNLMMLRMADTILDRGGALYDAWMRVENADPEYADHRLKKAALLSQRPEAFAKAQANAVGSIQRFESTSVTPRFGSFNG